MTSARPPDPIEDAARRAAQRVEQGKRVPEPPLGARLGQIGILGWTIVLPTLLGVLLGRWLDRHFVTGIFSAPLIMLGAAVGFWSAWKWMRRS